MSGALFGSMKSHCVCHTGIAMQDWPGSKLAVQLSRLGLLPRKKSILHYRHFTNTACIEVSTHTAGMTSVLCTCTLRLALLLPTWYPVSWQLLCSLQCLLQDSKHCLVLQDGSVQVYNTHQMSKMATLKGHRRYPPDCCILRLSSYSCCAPSVHHIHLASLYIMTWQRVHTL